MKVTVIIVNFRTPELVQACLTSVRRERAALPGLEVVIVDGGSGDNSASILEELTRSRPYRGWCKLMAMPLNGGFGWANNQALLAVLRDQSPAEFVHLLNPDTVVHDGAITALARLLAKRPNAGGVGSQLLQPDGTPTPSAFRFPSPLKEFIRGARTKLISKLLGVPDGIVQGDGAPVEADWVTGASVMFRVEALRQVGLFDQGFFLYHEEVELMWRIRSAGWAIWHEPASKVTHIEGASTGFRAGRRAESLPRRPSYWYESRRRMFSLMYGPQKARVAAIVWAFGHLLWLLRQAMGSGQNKVKVDHEFRDQLLIGLRARGFDSVRAIPEIETPVGVPPAWMTFDDKAI